MTSDVIPEARKRLELSYFHLYFWLSNDKLLISLLGEDSFLGKVKHTDWLPCLQ